jgi:hypothetical protein
MTNPNWCVFCTCEVPDDRLACDKCRPLVDKLDRKRQRLFKREEKRLKEFAELQATIERLKRDSARLKLQKIDHIRDWLEIVKEARK